MTTHTLLGGVLLLAGCAYPYPYYGYRPYPYYGYPYSPRPYYSPPPSSGNGYPPSNPSPQDLQRYGSQPWQNYPAPNPEGEHPSLGYPAQPREGYTTTPLPTLRSDQPIILNPAPPPQNLPTPPQTLQQTPGSGDEGIHSPDFQPSPGYEQAPPH
jgi:hypothetical protein